MLPVKKDRLGLLNPVASAKENELSSQKGSAELIWAVMGGGEFYKAKHILAPGEERRDRQKTV